MFQNLSIGEVLGLITFCLSIIGAYIRLSQQIETNRKTSKYNQSRMTAIEEKTNRTDEKINKVFNVLTELQTTIKLQYERTKDSIEEIKEKL